MTSPDYEISTDPARFDRDLIHRVLDATYWAKGLPRDVLERSIANALCFGVYREERQIAFARVITDRATFAYLSDVFVVPEEQGKGISKRLVEAILAHPELQGLRRFLLVTKDAHGLYERYGFQPVEHPGEYLTIFNPDAYRTSGEG